MDVPNHTLASIFFELKSYVILAPIFIGINSSGNPDQLLFRKYRFLLSQE